MGAKVTVCGPPTLIPREIEALGCERDADARRTCSEADVVYVLRMQHERMRESFVPSLREYAARYQINAARLQPGQLLMHPGPGQPRRRAVGGRDRLAAGADRRAGQGRGRGPDGGPLRAAGRLAEPAGGGGMSAIERLFHQPRAAGRPADPRGARARPAHRPRRAPRRPDPRRRRSPSSARAGTLRRRPTATTRRRGRQAPVPGVRRPARAPAHARPGVQGEPRHRHRRGRRRRLLRGDRDAEHRRRSSTRRSVLRLADRRARPRRRASRSASWPRSPAGSRGEELTEMAELRDAGALGFTDDGKPVISAGMLRKALQYQRLCGGVIALHEEDPALSGDGVMHEGAVSARLGLAGIPSICGVDDGRPRRRAGPVRGRARPLPAPLVRRVGGGARRRPRRPGARVSGEASPAPPDADRRRRPDARHAASR